ncbi:unnamed protein product [Arabidopsis halleri]
MVLKPCSAQKTIEGESSKLEEAKMESMEASSMVVSYFQKKRKFESDTEEEEDSVGESERSTNESEDTSDEEAKMEEPEAKFDMMKAPEWDQPYSNMEKANKHYHIYKRQIIESKGFYAEPEFSLCYNYNRIFPMSLDQEAP